MMIFLQIVFFLNVSLHADTIKIMATEDDNTKPKIRFDLSNQTGIEYFCRSIKLKNVRYFNENSDYYFTMDAFLTDKYVLINKISSYIDENKELDDLIKMVEGRALYSKFDKDNLVYDCEPKASRMNNILILDQCGDNLTLKTFTFDGPNSTLISKSNKEVNFSKSARFFKINSKNSIVIQDNKNVLLSTIDNDNINPNHQLQMLENDEAVIAAFSFKTDNLSIATFSLTKGIIFYFYLEENDKYNLVKKYELPNSSIKVSETEIKNLALSVDFVNEIHKFYNSQFKDILENLSIYSRNIVSASVFEIVIQARVPSFTLVKKGFVNNQWIYHINPLGIYENSWTYNSNLKVSYDQDIEIKQGNNLEMSKADELVDKNIYLKEGYSNEINFREYKILGIDKKVYTKSTSNANATEGFCSIKNIFSDLSISWGDFDLNQRYEGVTALIEAVRKQNYEKVVNLLAQKASVLAYDSFGRSPLYYSLENDDIKLIKLLLENGSDINETIKGESLFTNYLIKKLTDFQSRKTLDIKQRLNKLVEVYDLFKKYNYNLNEDQGLSKIKEKLNRIKDNQIILDALEIK